MGCAAGPCKEQRAEASTQKPVQATLPMNEVKPTDRVKVFKADGSLQCGQGKAIPVAEMQKQLKGITVFSAVNKMDGLMHIQACGTPTGQSNVYEIDRADLEKAKKLGFREWTFD
ncbi:MAG: hypothetical protein KF681_14255 [Bdellovibrionaceae bacterium]|nr:hypothetical protein [Pseudobdellovibrionaceae bacterium]